MVNFGAIRKFWVNCYNGAQPNLKVIYNLRYGTALDRHGIKWDRSFFHYLWWVRQFRYWLEGHSTKLESCGVWYWLWPPWYCVAGTLYKINLDKYGAVSHRHPVGEPPLNITHPLLIRVLTILIETISYFLGMIYWVRHGTERNGTLSGTIWYWAKQLWNWVIHDTDRDVVLIGTVWHWAGQLWHWVKYNTVLSKTWYW